MRIQYDQRQLVEKIDRDFTTANALTTPIHTFTRFATTCSRRQGRAKLAAFSGEEGVPGAGLLNVSPKRSADGLVWLEWRLLSVSSKVRGVSVWLWIESSP